ncbi:MAG: transketolase, partial [Desulfovibrio sp.]|nr:transketolase [Desulfovibrio sp.]
MASRRELADCIRVLSMDAIEKAQSGHPGAPMGMADMAEVLWRHALKHNPQNPKWINRDRFVLSNGHASMLLYALLYLTGYDLPLSELKNFRQLGSKTPGHPEFGVTSGVEMTTGPLGQGIASAVGMALAEKMLAAQFNRPNFSVVDHYTYCFVGDGCLMEGVSSEASSLAAIWNLGKLIVFYDSNGISIDGKVDGWFAEDVAARYRAYGWQVIDAVDGHDHEAMDLALQGALSDTLHPSLLILNTHIGLGSSRQDQSSCHGAPLGENEIARTKAAYGWKEPAFVIPEEMLKMWDGRAKGAQYEAEWNALFDAYKEAYPEEASELSRRMRGDLPEQFDKTWELLLKNVVEEKKLCATRKASQHCLEYFTAV